MGRLLRNLRRLADRQRHLQQRRSSPHPQQSVPDFAAIANQANPLVRPSTVRPFAEQFITGAATQANALNVLAATWEPYQASAWDAYDALINDSALSRRQVRSSLDELEFQYGIN